MIGFMMHENEIMTKRYSSLRHSQTTLDLGINKENDNKDIILPVNQLNSFKDLSKSPIETPP
jgi:hypothetical protein